MMRALLLVAGAALGLAACNGSQGNSDMNNTASDNMAMDQNLTMDQNAMMGTDMNGDMNSADANAAAAAGVDPSNAAAVEKLKQKDMKTNDADTNLANGM